MKDEQRIDGTRARVFYEVDVPAVENCKAILVPFHVSHNGSVGMVASQEKVCILEGN